MSEAAAVTVVGIGDDGWAGLTKAARAALRQAPVIVGSDRQLALLPELGVPREPLPSPLLARLDELVAANPGLCLLASGDPMLHGLGATLARRLGAGRLRVLPTVSSVALACARLGWAEHEVDVVSLVSRPVEAVLPAVQPGARVLARSIETLVLLMAVGNLECIAAFLLEGGRRAGTPVACIQHAGTPRQQVTTCSLTDLAVSEVSRQIDSPAVAVIGPTVPVLLSAGSDRPPSRLADTGY